MADPALGVTGLDTGIVDLGDDGGSAGDLSSLALSAAHAAKTGGDEQTAGEVLIVGDAELQTAGVEQRVNVPWTMPWGPMYIQPPAVI